MYNDTIYTDIHRKKKCMKFCSLLWTFSIKSVWTVQFYSLSFFSVCVCVCMDQRVLVYMCVYALVLNSSPASLTPPFPPQPSARLKSSPR